MKKNCLICNEEFKTFPCKEKTGRGKFCGMECRNEWKRTHEMPGTYKEGHAQSNTGRTFFSKGVSSWNKGKELSPSHKAKARIAMLGKKHSIQTRLKMSEIRKGEKSHFWKGGVDKINNVIRNSVQYKLWREAVFERDNYTCVWCGIRSGNGVAVILNADHIQPFALFHELRFDINNGRTLCVTCHRKTDTWGSPRVKEYAK